MRSLVTLWLCGTFLLRAAGASFTIVHQGTPTEAQPAIQYAADIWGGILVSDVAIKVNVRWFPLGSFALGITFPNGRKDFTGAPLNGTMYPTSLANAITGVEQNVGEDDITIYLNSGTAWYYGVDGNTPNGQYDLVSIALHELGHGLGIVGVSKKEGTEGSFGQVMASDFSPLAPSFPWPAQDGSPGIFDRYLMDAFNSLLVDLPNPSALLGTAFTNNQVYWSGPFGLAGSSNVPVRMYAPATFALGSSCVHLNEATYPVGNPNELMTPFSSAGEANHWPGPIVLGMLRDIGWTLQAGVGLAEVEAGSRDPWFHPNPASSVISIAPELLRSKGTLQIHDAQGRLVHSGTALAQLDLTTLPAGWYTIALLDRDHTLRGRLIKE
jgi:hypothetical protein